MANQDRAPNYRTATDAAETILREKEARDRGQRPGLDWDYITHHPIETVKCGLRGIAMAINPANYFYG